MAEVKKSSEQVQQPRITPTEKSLLQGTFKDNEELLKALRNLLFGYELDERETALIQSSFAKPELKVLMRKIFLPELQKDDPVGQSVDLWMTVTVENKPVEERMQIMAARKVLISLIDQALKLLDDPTFQKNNLLVTDVPEYSWLIARNTFISHIQLQIAVIRTLANMVELTPEEAVMKMKKDSSK